MTEQLETCERCQMRLPRTMGVGVPGVRGGAAWRCAACLPQEDLMILGLTAAREEVIKIRRQHWNRLEELVPSGTMRVDLGAGDDRTIWRCGACGFTAGTAGEINQHAKDAHGWTGLVDNK